LSSGYLRLARPFHLVSIERLQATLVFLVLHHPDPFPVISRWTPRQSFRACLPQTERRPLLLHPIPELELAFEDFSKESRSSLPSRPQEPAFYLLSPVRLWEVLSCRDYYPSIFSTFQVPFGIHHCRKFRRSHIEVRQTVR